MQGLPRRVDRPGQTTQGMSKVRLRLLEDWKSSQEKKMTDVPEISKLCTFCFLTHYQDVMVKRIVQDTAECKCGKAGCQHKSEDQIPKVSKP